MKKHILVSITLILNLFILDAQMYTLFDNFDEQGKVNWIFRDGWAGGYFNQDTINPSKSGINTSERVGKLLKTSDTISETVLSFFLEKPFNLSANNHFRMKVYGQEGLKVSLSLWRAEMNNWGDSTGQSREYIISQTDIWEEALFDFSDVADSTRYDKVVIQINKGEFGQGILYIDDIEGPLYTDTSIPLFALTSYYGDMVELKCSNYMTLPGNSADDFELKVNNQIVDIDSVSLNPDFTRMIVLHPHDSISEGDIVTCSYSGSSIFSLEGWQLQSFDNLPVANGVKQSEVLVWSDEFNEPKLDTSIWKRMDSDYWFNNEIQSYTPNDTNSYIQDSVLHIVAYEQDRGIRNYTSARLETRHRMSFRYGKIVASLKLSTGSGYWPAFWMMPVDDEYGGWPYSGEIDIMEFFGDQGSTRYPKGGGAHFWNYSENWRDHEGGFKDWIRGKLNEQFSTFTMIWDEDAISFNVNEEVYSKVKATNVGLSNWVFDKDFYIILNLALSPRYGDPSLNTYPQSFLIDYVRIYKVPTGKPASTEPNSAFSVDSKGEISIYPNPAKGIIHIKNSTGIQFKSYAIYNLNGKLEKQGVIIDETIGISNLPSGLYLVILESDNDIFKRKIMIE